MRWKVLEMENSEGYQSMNTLIITGTMHLKMVMLANFVMYT